MFKLLIVDDEEKIREGLKKFIDWPFLEVDAIETANNGLEALESIKNWRPDLILCDVKMPKMNGIEFSTKLKEIIPDCKIIFLSGFADKEYLKAAIHLNAVDYIEKPVNPEEVTAVVQLAISRLKEEKKQIEKLEFDQKSISENMYLIRQEIVLSLLRTDADAKRIMEQYGQTVFNIPLQGKLTAFCIHIHWKSNQTAIQKSAIKDAFLRQLNGALSEDLTELPSEKLTGFLNENCACLVSGGSLNPANLLTFLLNSWSDAMSVSIGCGQAVACADELFKSYRQAELQVSQEFYTGVNKAYGPASTLVAPQPLTASKDILLHFKSLIKKGKYEQSEKYVYELTDKIRQGRSHDVAAIRRLYVDFMIVLYNHIWENESVKPEESQNQDIWEETTPLATIKELSELVIRYIRSLEIKLDDTATYKRKIYEISKFVQGNYSDTNLTIKAISEEVYLTQTYLCAFFKKYTGKTLNEYITEVRLDRSRELLRDGSLKLYDVAERVGYTDPHYFSVLFKKQYGCLPSEYRERL